MSSFNNQIHFILGSGSPRRKDLLNQIGISPNIVIKPEIDEDIFAKEFELILREKNITMNTILSLNFFIFRSSFVKKSI